MTISSKSATWAGSRHAGGASMWARLKLSCCVFSTPKCSSMSLPSSRGKIVPLVTLRTIVQFLTLLYYSFQMQCYCSTWRVWGGVGADSPQTLQKRALGRFIRPQGHVRNLLEGV